MQKLFEVFDHFLWTLSAKSEHHSMSGTHKTPGGHKKRKSDSLSSTPPNSCYKKQDQRSTPEIMASGSHTPAPKAGETPGNRGENEFDQDDLELSQIASEIDNLDAKDDGSYVAAVKKTRFDWPYALYVQAGTAQRKKISKSHWLAFETHIWESRIKLSQDENSQINIDWVVYRNDYGIVACLDAFLAQYVKKLASNFQFENDSTRAWARWERSEGWVFQGFLHGNLWKKLKGRYALSKILTLNGLQGQFDNLTWDTKPPNGVWCTFEPKGLLAEALTRKNRLDGGTCSIKLQKRWRKAKTEEQFFESRGKLAAAALASRSAEMV